MSRAKTLWIESGFHLLGKNNRRMTACRPLWRLSGSDGSYISGGIGLPGRYLVREPLGNGSWERNAGSALARGNL